MLLNARDELARQVRCFVNEVEVSDNCFEADDEAGYALVYKKHPNHGHIYLWWADTHEEMLDTWVTNINKDRAYEPAWERLEGVVRFEFNP